MSEAIAVSEADGRAALARIAARAPWTAVDDVEAFTRRWKYDRAACERDADTRRSADPGRVTAPTPA